MLVVNIKNKFSDEEIEYFNKVRKSGVDVVFISDKSFEELKEQEVLNRLPKGSIIGSMDGNEHSIVGHEKRISIKTLSENKVSKILDILDDVALKCIDENNKQIDITKENTTDIIQYLNEKNLKVCNAQLSLDKNFLKLLNKLKVIDSKTSVVKPNIIDEYDLDKGEIEITPTDKYQFIKDLSISNNVSITMYTYLKFGETKETIKEEFEEYEDFSIVVTENEPNPNIKIDIQKAYIDNLNMSEL